MNKKWLMVLMLASIFTTGQSFAQDKTGGKKPHENKFKELDTNGDGKLSLAEAEKSPKGKLKENFAAIDTNKDSYLDKEELKAYKKEKKAHKKAKQK